MQKIHQIKHIWHHKSAINWKKNGMESF